MSKANAYKCDKCGALDYAGNVAGISPVADIFSIKDSYPFITTPAALAACTIHVCFACRFACQEATERLHGPKPPGTGEDYQRWLDGFNEVSYAMRSGLVLKVAREGHRPKPTPKSKRK